MRECWCNVLEEYVCFDCVNSEKWDSIPQEDRLLIIKYHEFLEIDVDFKRAKGVLKKVIDRGLDVHLIPNEVKACLQQLP